MATKKVAKKKGAKKKAAKNMSWLKPCKVLQVNSDGSITPPMLKLKHDECIRLRSPKGYSVDMKLVITLTAGSGGPITVHS
jgi:hypothetical protein